jgi:hypothetical protein
MKKSLLIALTLLCISSLAMAQAGSIGVFMDAGGTICDLSNSPANFMQVRVVHVNSPGSTASQFSVRVYGTPLTIIGELSNYNTIGSAAGGIAVAYGPCMVSPIHALTVSYLGTSAPCDYIAIEADPTADPPAIYVTDCATPVPNLLTGTGGMGFVNNDGNCPCNVPAEDTSWGQIKALYQ